MPEKRGWSECGEHQPYNLLILLAGFDEVNSELPSIANSFLSLDKKPRLRDSPQRNFQPLWALHARGTTAPKVPELGPLRRQVQLQTWFRAAQSRYTLRWQYTV